MIRLLLRQPGAESSVVCFSKDVKVPVKVRRTLSSVGTSSSNRRSPSFCHNDDRTMVKHCFYKIHQKTNQGIHPQHVKEYAHHATFLPCPKCNKQSKTEGIWGISQHDACSEYGVGIKPGQPGSGKGQTIYLEIWSKAQSVFVTPLLCIFHLPFLHCRSGEALSQGNRASEIKLSMLCLSYRVQGTNVFLVSIKVDWHWLQSHHVWDGSLATPATSKPGERVAMVIVCHFQPLSHVKGPQSDGNK
jgi:hypothetical protein